MDGNINSASGCGKMKTNVPFRASLCEISVKPMALPIRPKNDSFMVGNSSKYKLSVQHFPPSFVDIFIL